MVQVREPLMLLCLARPELSDVRAALTMTMSR